MRNTNTTPSFLFLRGDRERGRGKREGADRGGGTSRYRWVDGGGRGEGENPRMEEGSREQTEGEGQAEWADGEERWTVGERRGGGYLNLNWNLIPLSV